MGFQISEQLQGRLFPQAIDAQRIIVGNQIKQTQGNIKDIVLYCFSVKDLWLHKSEKPLPGREHGLFKIVFLFADICTPLPVYFVAV